MWTRYSTLICWIGSTLILCAASTTAADQKPSPKPSIVQKQIVEVVFTKQCITSLELGDKTEVRVTTETPRTVTVEGPVIVNVNDKAPGCQVFYRVRKP
jgi:aromatic ring hydroxylase